MRIAVIGAGAVGVGCAKVLTRVGHAVTVLDEGPDIGGTGSTADTAGASTSLDHLRAYVAEFALHPYVQLNAVVSSAVRTTTGWELTVRSAINGRTSFQEFDHLVIATPVVPTAISSLPGAREFAAVGGEHLSTADLPDVERVRDRNVVVVGHGSSACEVALEASEAARQTHLVRGSLPRAARNSTRRSPGDLGDRHRSPRRPEVEVLHEPFAEAFAERVGSGRIEVRQDQHVERLVVHDGGPCAVLSDGSMLPADLLVHTTGPQQQLSYLGADVVEQLLDGRGNLSLYRQVHPIGVPTLSFAGANSPAAAPQDAELVAAWTAARLAGLVTVPDDHHLIDLTSVPNPSPEANPMGPSHQERAARPVFSGDLHEIRHDLAVVVGERRRSSQQDPSGDVHLVREVERRVLVAGVVGIR